MIMHGEEVKRNSVRSQRMVSDAHAAATLAFNLMAGSCLKSMAFVNDAQSPTFFRSVRIAVVEINVVTGCLHADSHIRRTLKCEVAISDFSPAKVRKKSNYH